MNENVILENRGKKVTIIWTSAIVILTIVLFVFFTFVHPLYIYDTDDWTYISYSRHAWPTVDQWNPAKILPETLMPLSAELGIRFIMPFTGDYIRSMSIAFAAVLVLFIMGYVLSFGKTVRNLFDIKADLALLIMIAFILYHFLPFSVSVSGNKYLFYGGSVNCTFNYLIPGLLNATLVMWLINQEKRHFKSKLSIGVFLLFIYLALNSNMFHSIILASYAGANILVSFMVGVLNCKKCKSEGIKYIKTISKHNTLWIAIDIVWLIMLTFEARGARAAKASVKLFELPIKDTLNKFTGSLVAMNKLYLISMFGFICAGILVYFVNSYRKNIGEYDSKYIGLVLKILISFLITWIYLLLLCAKVSPDYMVNSLVEFSWMFWLMFFAFMSLAYVFARVPKLAVCMPVFLYILTFETVIDGKIYAENNVAGFDPAIVKMLDDNIIKQIKEAERLGHTDVVVYIPVHSSEDWPMALSYGGERISLSLYRHGITTKKINVTLEMNPAINEIFHLN